MGEVEPIDIFYANRKPGSRNATARTVDYVIALLVQVSTLRER
jgi:hypothetical protein